MDAIPIVVYRSELAASRTKTSPSTQLCRLIALTHALETCTARAPLDYRSNILTRQAEPSTIDMSGQEQSFTLCEKPGD
jgi:hypothetical protein